MKILKRGKEDLEHYKGFKTLFFSFFIFLFLFIKLGPNITLLYYAVFSYILLVLCFYDLKYKAAPDYLLLAIFILSFFITDFSFMESLQNALLLSGFMVLLNFLVTFYIQNIKSRLFKDESLKTKIALGEGDIPLIASIGVILGLEKAIITIFLSAIIGIIHAVYTNIIRKDSEIPFIPSLVTAFFLEYFLQISNYFKDFY